MKPSETLICSFTAFLNFSIILQIFWKSLCDGSLYAQTRQKLEAPFASASFAFSNILSSAKSGNFVIPVS